MSSLHPWGWLTVFQCGVLERVAISCCVAMHVPLRSKLNCLSNKAPRHCLFLYISTEDQLPCRTKHNKAFYVIKQFFIFSLSLCPLYLLFLFFILYTFPDLPVFFVTAQVPVQLLFKNIMFCFWGFVLFLFCCYYYLNCYSYVYLST